ncbi:HIT family protein [Patescibacteria group bacterium]
MNTKDCVFCKIVKGQLPCWKIYEDNDFLAFLDITPFTEGHTLVIPKKHYRWVWDVPNVGEYFKIAAKIINHYRQVANNQWVSSLVWGTDVPHAHIQVLPWPEKVHLNVKRGQLTEKQAKELVSQFALK